MEGVREVLNKTKPDKLNFVLPNEMFLSPKVLIINYLQTKVAMTEFFF